MSLTKVSRAGVKPGKLETVETVEAERLSSCRLASLMVGRVRRDEQDNGVGHCELAA